MSEVFFLLCFELNKLMSDSIFDASDLLLTMNFVITLSKLLQFADPHVQLH